MKDWDRVEWGIFIFFAIAIVGVLCLMVPQIRKPKCIRSNQKIIDIGVCDKGWCGVRLENGVTTIEYLPVLGGVVSDICDKKGK